MMTFKQKLFTYYGYIREMDNHCLFIMLDGRELKVRDISIFQYDLWEFSMLPVKINGHILDGEIWIQSIKIVETRTSMNKRKVYIH